MPSDTNDPGPLPPPPPPSPPVPSPHDPRELRAALFGPVRAMDLVLTEKRRFLVTLTDDRSGWLLVAVLFLTSLVFTIPYGLVLGIERPWRVAALFLGSVTICLPSLLVFSGYVGLGVAARRNLGLALVVTAVAALFTFGFFPILWFLALTMDGGTLVTTHGISVGLLAVSLSAGLLRLEGCLGQVRESDRNGACPRLVTTWMILVIFICHRMALLLELL